MYLQTFQPQPADVFRISKKIEESRFETEAPDLHQRRPVVPPLKPENQIVARRPHRGIQRYLQVAQFNIALISLLQRRDEVIARHRLNSPAAGTSRIKVKMSDALTLARLHGADRVDWALGHAALYGRFAETDLAAILAAQPTQGRRQAGEVHPLQGGTRAWERFGR